MKEYCLQKDHAPLKVNKFCISFIEIKTFSLLKNVQSIYCNFVLSVPIFTNPANSVFAVSCDSLFSLVYPVAEKSLDSKGRIMA